MRGRSVVDQLSHKQCVAGATPALAKPFYGFRQARSATRNSSLETHHFLRKHYAML